MGFDTFTAVDLGERLPDPDQEMDAMRLAAFFSVLAKAGNHNSAVVLRATDMLTRALNHAINEANPARH